MNTERSRLNLLQSIQDVHKNDIKTYVSGHLNQSKLKLSDPESSVGRDKWTTSTQPPTRLKPASFPMNKPVRKGQLSQTSIRRKTMINTVAEFSFGALGCYFGAANSVGSNDDKNSTEDETSPMRNKGTTRDITKSAFVEELKLPEIMLSTKKKKTTCSLVKKNVKTTVPLKHHFVKSHLSQVTKEGQYGAMKHFERTVMNIQNANDKGLLTGERIVRKLQRHLNKKLQPLNDFTRRGPNFHRLQAYSDCFNKIIENSTTFSRLLKMIKDEYDSYLAYILDQNRVSQHEELYSQMLSLSKAKSVAESIEQQQNVLYSLEENVSELLTENERLRQQMKAEKVRPVATTNVKKFEESATKTRVSVEEFPKDFQEQVEDLHCEIADQLEALEKMRKYQQEKCVPSSVCQHFEQCIKDTDVDLQKLLKQNEFLEQSIDELQSELERLLYPDEHCDKNARVLWKAIGVDKVLELKNGNK